MAARTVVHVMPHPGGVWRVLTQSRDDTRAPFAVRFLSRGEALAEARRRADVSGLAEVRLYRREGGVEVEHHVETAAMRVHRGDAIDVARPLRPRARLRTSLRVAFRP